MEERVWEQIKYPHIYMIINNVNGKKYIGQHSGNNINYVASGKVINYAFRKYGKKNFSRLILEFWQYAPENLDEIETNYIKLYETLVPLGYNISETGTGRIQYGNIPWNKGGGEYSIETRKKMSDAKLGSTLPEEHKEKISQSLLGKSKTSEHSMNIRIGGSKRPILQLDLEGNIINEFINCQFAAESVGCKRESIRDTCNDKIKVCKGYKWIYKQ